MRRLAVAGRVAATDGVLYAPCSGRRCAREVGKRRRSLCTDCRVDFSLEAWHGHVRSCRVSQKASDGLRATFKHDMISPAHGNGARTGLSSKAPRRRRSSTSSRNGGPAYPGKTKPFFARQPRRRGAAHVPRPPRAAGTPARPRAGRAGRRGQNGLELPERRSWNALLAPGRARVLASDDPKHLPEKLRKLEAPLPEAIGERGNPPGGAGGDVNTTDWRVVRLGAICGG